MIAFDGYPNNTRITYAEAKKVLQSKAAIKKVLNTYHPKYHELQYMKKSNAKWFVAYDLENGQVSDISDILDMMDFIQ